MIALARVLSDSSKTHRENRIYFCFYCLAYHLTSGIRENKGDGATAHIGKTKTVRGAIAKVYNSGKACFLNFALDYKGKFAVVIFAKDYNKFPKEFWKHYLNKKVRVSGIIDEHNNMPEIIISDPAQIKIMK